MKKMLIASTSTIFGSAYLEYILTDLAKFFKGIDEILFIPYARPSGISHQDYTTVARNAFKEIGIKIRGIHEFKNPQEAVKNAKAIFTGGGNTFVLVNALYKNGIMNAIKKVVENGTLYFGTSAGSNITGVNMKTTNDMPIVLPPSFETLGLIPFNLNPHYLDSDPSSKHKGETRETRITEFHTYNSIPVLGLREGSWLEVNNNVITLKGEYTARLFRESETTEEVAPGVLNISKEI
ncbi:Alpha-aspartyl dipeptidase Peptidase E [hydrothermal vent metagenome]|uniref:Alpha-aspartyl dipeptidase Peptidase E n=1 Tax=hydrothermal vent metagenome TaxID=652676 RepID=A0A3B0RRS8_9ZZZZ